MPLPDVLVQAPAAPVEQRPARRSPDDVLRDYTARFPAASDATIVSCLDGWDAGALLSHYTRSTDTNSADHGPAYRRN